MAERTEKKTKIENQEAQKASFFKEENLLIAQDKKFASSSQIKTVGRFTVESFDPEIFGHQCQPGARIRTLIKNEVIILGTVCDVCSQKFGPPSTIIPNNTNERTFLDIRERIKADLAHIEEELQPKILNFWGSQGKLKFVLVGLRHCDPAADPNSECQGRIMTKIDFSQKIKERQSCCQECHQEATINIPTLKVELRLLPVF